MSLRQECIEANNMNKKSKILQEQEEAKKFTVRAKEKLNEVLNYVYYYGDALEEKIDYTSQMKILEEQPYATLIEVDDLKFLVGTHDSKPVVKVIKKCEKCGEEFESWKVHFRADIGDELSTDLHSQHTCQNKNTPTQTVAERLEELIRDIAAGEV